MIDNNPKSLEKKHKLPNNTEEYIGLCVVTLYKIHFSGKIPNAAHMTKCYAANK